MPRIERDPTLELMPDFESDTFRMAFTALATEETLVETIIQRSKDAWSTDHQARVVAWQRQSEEDEAARKLLEEHQAAIEEERRTAEEEMQRREKEERDKKKLKVKVFVPNKQVETQATSRPSQYALNKVKSLEFVELYYFTEEGCTEARQQDRSTSGTTLTFAQEEGMVLLTPAAAHKPSNKVIQDEKLTWRQMSMGKTGLLKYMEKEEGWPQAHVVALATFYMELDLHEMRRQPFGEEALLQYHAEVRKDWHEQLKSTDDSIQPFDISRVNQEHLGTIYQRLLNQKQARNIARSVPILQ